MEIIRRAVVRLHARIFDRRALHIALAYAIVILGCLDIAMTREALRPLLPMPSRTQ